MRRYTPTGGWAPAEVVATGVLPHVAVDSSGAVLLAHSADSQVRFQRHQPVSGWTAPQRLDSITDDGVSPHYLALAASPSGLAIVLWEQHHWHSGYAYRGFAATP